MVAPESEPYVVPATLAILAVLFAVQRLGTGSVAKVFGPVTALWFLALGASGLMHIADDPHILAAVNPVYIVAFLVHSPEVAFVTVGAIFLAVTGAEALYADLGHFGRKPIVRAWLWIVFPCLLLDYLGQGAFVLGHGGVVGNPFFEMQGGGWMLPAGSDMPAWQDRLFIGLAGTAADATQYFHIPTGRVVEIGTQVAI